MMGFNMQSDQDVPKPAPLWCKETVGAVGPDCVRKWYEDIAAMNWTYFVGAHGGPARNCDHDAMLQAANKQIEGGV